MPEYTPKKVPARYIGSTAMRLAKGREPYIDASGQHLTHLFLNPGDTLMLPDIELFGQTYLFDPRGEKEPLWLGVGRVVLPEHQNLSVRELAVLGYEFHTGRVDFEPLTPPASSPAPQQPSVSEPLSGGTVTPADGTPLTFSRSEQGV